MEYDILFVQQYNNILRTNITYNFTVLDCDIPLLTTLDSITITASSSAAGTPPDAAVAVRWDNNGSDYWQAAANDKRQWIQVRLESSPCWDLI
jgi:hypothetical protein